MLIVLENIFQLNSNASFRWDKNEKLYDDEFYFFPRLTPTEKGATFEKAIEKKTLFRSTWVDSRFGRNTNYDCMVRTVFLSCNFHDAEFQFPLSSCVNTELIATTNAGT